MGGTKKSSANNRKANIWFVVGFFVFIIVIFVTWFVVQLTLNRPNYRDLDKEYKQLNIPADWQLKSINKSGDTFGGTLCLEIDLTCPNLSVDYEPKKNTLKTSEDINKLMLSIIGDSGYRIVNSSAQCASADVQNNDFDCSITGTKNKIKIYFSISSDDPYGNKIGWAHINYSANNDSNN